MDSMIIDNGPVAVSFPCHFYCSTNGKGAWTEKVFATLIHRVVLFESGEIWAFYKPCLDTEAAKEWENSGELIYTDPQWIALFNRFGTNLRIFYTEQGMQGRNYVSMESNNFDLCKEIFQSFANKEKENCRIKPKPQTKMKNNYCYQQKKIKRIKPSLFC